jgi:DNA-binding response OmpR family regulator
MVHLAVWRFERIRFCFACQALFSLSIRLHAGSDSPEERLYLAVRRPQSRPDYTVSPQGGTALSEVGILIVDNDVVSQRALKNVLDAEGWRVRIVPTASHALPELASGEWNLAIVNSALIDVKGPVFAILRDLALAETPADEPAIPLRRFRVLFMVPILEEKKTLPFLESQGLPYSLKPYHLHDFLEKVSELLLESGALQESLRGIGDFSGARNRKRARNSARTARRGTMFASREDYQMTEEEMAEFERQEEEERKKREKEAKERGYRY